MTPIQAPAFLPALLGALYQRSAHGELALEQNDGTRRFFFSFGKLVFLQSAVAGEQFGNYLLRQGVLDLASLKELLADPRDERLGEKVVSWGLLTSEQRNEHLADLYDLILVNALEHPVVEFEWTEEATASNLAGGVPIALDHRQLVWGALNNLNTARSIPAWISSQRDWKWQAPPGLLGNLADLPIEPQQAYALSFLGAEPLSFDTLVGASGLEPEQGARLVLALWATGNLSLAEGELPSPSKKALLPAPPVEAPKASAARSQIITGQIPILREEGSPRVEKPPVVVVPPVKPKPLPAPEPAPPVEFDHIEIMDDDGMPDEGSMPAVVKPSIQIQTISGGARNLGGPAPESGEEAFPEPDEGDLRGRARKMVRVAKHLMLQDRTGDAIQALEQSVRLDPDSADAYTAWLMLGKMRTTNPAWSTRAVEALQAASKLNPKAGEPWAVMGEIYHRKGFRTNAKGCFQKALELDPSVPIPPDFVMEDNEPEADEKGVGGMFGRLKGFMKL